MTEDTKTKHTEPENLERIANALERLANALEQPMSPPTQTEFDAIASALGSIKNAKDTGFTSRTFV